MKNELVVKAYDRKKREIGRSKVAVSFEAEEAKYITFTLPKELDKQTVIKYHINHVTPKPNITK